MNRHGAPQISPKEKPPEVNADSGSPILFYEMINIAQSFKVRTSMMFLSRPSLIQIDDF
jgi:hypothetical protein